MHHAYPSYSNAILIIKNNVLDIQTTSNAAHTYPNENCGFLIYLIARYRETDHISVHGITEYIKQMLVLTSLNHFLLSFSTNFSFVLYIFQLFKENMDWSNCSTFQRKHELVKLHWEQFFCKSRIWVGRSIFFLHWRQLSEFNAENTPDNRILYWPGHNTIDVSNDFFLK